MARSVLVSEDARIVRPSEIERMVKAGMSARAIARETGLSQPTVTRWLNKSGYQLTYVKKGSD